MNKLYIFVLLVVASADLAASELSTVDEPEVETGAQVSAILKNVGRASSFKSRQRVFLRDGVKVAALITTAHSIDGKTPIITKFVQFYIDSDNWIKINLDDPGMFSSHFAFEVSVEASNDSITVIAPKKKYCEVFFKSNGAFLDGADRERLARDSLRGSGVTSPR